MNPLKTFEPAVHLNGITPVITGGGLLLSVVKLAGKAIISGGTKLGKFAWKNKQVAALEVGSEIIDETIN